LTPHLAWVRFGYRQNNTQKGNKMKIFDAKYLPKTRLELKWSRDDNGSILEGGDWRCDYNLVLEMTHYDIRAESDNGEPGFIDEKVISLGGCTSQRTSSPYRPDDKHIDSPFRDSSHIQWDSAKLNNLPMFVVCAHRAMSIAPNPESQSSMGRKE
jgi:hypothetical protein